MRLHHTMIALSLIAALCACATAQDKGPDTRPVQDPAPVEVADPMASFARMVPGEWRVTFTSGTSAFDSWTWGPGKHSIRAGELEVMYWHPGRKQVCLLSLHPDIPGIGRGAGEGTIKFEGETASGVLDLYQPPGRRKLATRWTFEGPDKYHDVLLEDTGAGFRPLAEWDRFRVPKRSEHPRTGEEKPNLPERLKALEPLLNRTWNARSVWGGSAGKALHIETILVPLADAIYVRSFALRGNGSPVHALDAYIYHHPGTDRLRCLALLDLDDMGETEGVYEGDLTVLDGGALQFELKGYEGERVVPLAMRFDFDKDGTLHQRAWSFDAASGKNERTLMLDARHSASKISKSIFTVFQDSRNNYWFGSDVQGVYRYDGTTITNFSTKDGLCDDRVRGIQEDKAGNLYFTTANGISTFDGQVFRTLTPVKSNPPDKEWKLQPDDLWFPGAQDAGDVYRYDGITLHALEFPRTKLGDERHANFPRSQDPNIKSSHFDVYSIFKDTKGNVWFGTGTGTGVLSVCRYDGKSFAWISSDELEFGDLAFCVRSTIEDKDGKFWFSNTMNRFDVLPNDTAGQERVLVNFRKERGLGHSDDPFAFFMSSIKDKNGDLWMATYGAGVWRYDGANITHYPVKDGDKPVTLFSISKDNHGDLWLGTHEAGAYKFNGKTFERFRP